MKNFNKNRLVILIALIIMMIISATSGYRLHLGSGGLTFEQNAVAARRD